MSITVTLKITAGSLAVLKETIVERYKSLRAREVAEQLSGALSSEGKREVLALLAHQIFRLEVLARECEVELPKEGA